MFMIIRLFWISILCIHFCHCDFSQEVGDAAAPTVDVTPSLGYKETRPNKKLIQLGTLEENQAFEVFLNTIRQHMEQHELKGILKLSDPLQHSIQTDEINMEVCQYLKENFNLKNAGNKSDCDLLNTISRWEYDGYAPDEHFTYIVKGKVTFEDGLPQNFSFWVNQLTESTWIITGAVG